MKSLNPETEVTETLESSCSRIQTAATDNSSTRKGRGAEARSDSLSPQGLKHRLSMLEKVIHSQAEELANHKNEFMSLRKTKDKSDEVSETHMRGIEKNLIGEIERLRDEFSKTVMEQKTELGRVATQLRSLKAEKSMLQNQVAALQRRVLTIDEEIGHE